jgi:hypothetical protein
MQTPFLIPSGKAHITGVAQTGAAFTATTPYCDSYNISRTHRFYVFTCFFDYSYPFMPHDYPVFSFGQILEIIADQINIRAVYPHLFDPYQNLIRPPDFRLGNLKVIDTRFILYQPYSKHRLLPGPGQQVFI